MFLTYHILSVLSSLLFICYGAACLWSSSMIEEFERLNLARFRVLTGLLEIAGALGLAAGFFIPALRVLAAVGLGLLMTLAVIQRIRQRDSFPNMLQALVLAVITIWIAVFGAMEIL